MRPRRLSQVGVGPSATRAEVDHDRLAADGLSLKHEPTGAGKTFLLDAMCFALYGQVPGLRGPGDLRSDHAAPDQPTVAGPSGTSRVAPREQYPAIASLPRVTSSKTRSMSALGASIPSVTSTSAPGPSDNEQRHEPE